MQNGKVILVGAGPGDPGLMTHKGRQWLEKADVVVYDRLVAPETLACIPPQTETVYVGKEQGRHPVPQHEINQILAQKAKEGKLVVRLKGGDPFVFGRGGEELELLVQEGVPFEVVPGITSAVAALAYGGIPATHRDWASSLHIITGHPRQGGELNIDYEALAKTGGTLVFLMGVGSMGTIRQGLLAAGMDPATPAAVVENGTLPYQRKVVADLDTIVDKAGAQDIQSPAVFAVGGVCALSESLDWFGKLPLHGKTVVVTRPQNRAGTLCGKLAAQGAEVVPFPCIQTEPITPNPEALDALETLGQQDWLVLTSPQGAEVLYSLLRQAGKDARALAGVKVAAIGPATGRAMEAYGVVPDYIPPVYDAVHLGQGLAQQVGQGDKVLLMRAELGVPQLVALLEQAGAVCRDVATYRTIHTCENSGHVAKMLKTGRVDYVTFTSASTVAGFSECIPKAAKYPFTALCIGASTSLAAQKQGYKTLVAETASIDAMLDAILEDQQP